MWSIATLYDRARSSRFLAIISLENMADDLGRKWDRCLADTAVKTGFFVF